MGCDLGFNGGGWPIWVVVGLVIFGLRSGFRSVGLVFQWLRSGLVVFGLLTVCMYFVRRLLTVGLVGGFRFARRGSGFAHRGYGFCLLWVWVLLGGDHGLLFQKLPKIGRAHV